MVKTMAKLRMAHASTHGARKPPGPIKANSVQLKLKLGLSLAIKPFKCDSNDDVDGAAQGDVIERVESLGEEVSIDSTGLGKWPGKH